MFTVSVVLALFLLYFYYTTRQGTVTNHVKPSIPYTFQKPAFAQDFQEHGNTFQYLVNGQVTWKAILPNMFHLDQGKLTSRDVCYGQPDGSKHLATGKELYQMIQNDQLVQDNPHFEFNANTMAQEKQVFYFTCLQSRIHQVRMCPPGHAFKHQSCQPIDICHDQADGTRFTNRFNVKSYFECQNEKAVRKTCPKDHLFLFDHCASSQESALYCQFNDQPKIIDANTLLVCKDHNVTYESCPPGFRYFDKPYCQTNACDGQADGSLVPMPILEKDSLSYAPGYMQCRQHKVEKVEFCPVEWDPHQSMEENLTHLPQVFDGKKCSIPSFCHNVTSKDPDAIVPVYEFTKHVQNWKYSKLLDSLTGYQCEKGVKRRVNLDPGLRINKRFKREKACDGTRDKVPVSERPDVYYDCTLDQVQSCPTNHYFDAETCVPRIPNAFAFQGIDFFTLSGLRVDNWMPPWDYTKKALVKPCNAPESVWIEVYNLCSHPDCTLYPFLSQIDYPLKLKDGSQCEFRETDRRLIKTQPSDTPYHYWSQRKKIQSEEEDVCVPEQRIQTGHFVWDSTIYMTCQEEQPFVFCPSSNTRGIYFNNMYACLPDSMRGKIPPHFKLEFVRNEVRRILPLDQNAIVLIDKKDVIIPETGYVPPKEFVLETLLQGVEIVYNRRVTYPPQIYLLENQTLKKYLKEGAYMMKSDGFTQRAVDFPKHEVEKTIGQFILDE